MTTCLELGTHFLDSLLDHGMMESIKICRFKTFLEQYTFLSLFVHYYMLKIVFCI